MNKNDDSDHRTFINPAGFAEEVRGQPMPKVDYLLEDQDGKRLIPPEAPFREERRARALGDSAKDIAYGSDLADQVRPHQAQHDGLEAQLEAAEPRRSLGEQLLAALANRVLALLGVPNNTIDPARKKFATAVKTVLLTGDTAVIGIQYWRTGGAPIWLALITGLSLAGSVVAIGSRAGHQIAAADQRKGRGAPPNDTPAAVIALYDDGRAEESYQLWLQLALLAAGVMFLALFWLGKGTGDSFALSFGYGLLGALTVGGSAAAQAHATNDASEALALAEKACAAQEDKVKEFEPVEFNSAAARTNSVHLERAARLHALGTAAAVREVADRTTDTPDVAGYTDSGLVTDSGTIPRPVIEEANSLPQGPPRTRRRVRYALKGDLIPSERLESETPGSDGTVVLGPPMDMPPVDLSRQRLNGSTGGEF